MRRACCGFRIGAPSKAPSGSWRDQSDQHLDRVSCRPVRPGIQHLTLLDLQGEALYCALSPNTFLIRWFRRQVKRHTDLLRQAVRHLEGLLRIGARLLMA